VVLVNRSSAARRRAFRPVPDRLESLSPVSSFSGFAALAFAGGGAGAGVLAQRAREDKSNREASGPRTAFSNLTTRVASTLNSVRRVGWDQPTGAASGLYGLSAKPIVPAATAPWPTISAASLVSDSADSSSSLFAGSPHGDIAKDTGGVSQARSPGAGAIPTGPSAPASVAHYSAPAAGSGTAAASQAATPALSAASTVLGAAAAQSLNAGIRPMTMTPPSAVGSRLSTGRTLRKVSPDMGSGGGYSGPPNLISGTFGIEPIAGDPPWSFGADNPVPIGAEVYLTATSPGPTITSWNWSGGTYGSYLTGIGSAGSQPPPSQSAPTAPVGTFQSYGFIVSEPNTSYTVTVSVTYVGGGVGGAALTFSTVAPTWTLSVQQVGTQSATVIAPIISVQLSPPIQINATTTVGPNTNGQFMFMQIINSANAEYADDHGVPWHRDNGVDFPDYDGPLIDDGNPSALGYPYRYQGSPPNNYSWHLPDANGNNMIPTGNWSNPYMSDLPAFAPDLPDGGEPQVVSDSGSFSTYLMYMPEIQGSIWIGLAMVNWSWSETATPNGGPTTQQPAPTVTPALSGLAAFPTWVNTGSSYLTQPFQEGD
jgi:hypothetical protein